MEKEKPLKDFKKNAYNYTGTSYDLTKRINSSFAELEKWTTPQINPNLTVKHVLSKRQWTVETESHTDTTHYGAANSPLSMEERDEIRKNANRVEGKIANFANQILFSDDLVPFAYRKSTGGRWRYILGSIDGWVDLTYGHLSDVVNEARKEKETVGFVWKVGELLFYSASGDMLEPICAITNEKYCEKYIPAGVSLSAVAKVTNPGFSFIAYYLCVYLGQKVTAFSLNHQYENLRKTHAIPFVPITWQLDLELIKTDKFVKNARKIIVNKPDDEDEKIIKAIEDIKAQINSTLKAENNQNNWLKLSEILDIRFSTSNANEMWSDEFMVDVDETIVVEDMELSEDKILLGILSWGVLELLVEDDALPEEDFKRFEKNLELDNSIAVSILTVSSDKGKKLLEKFTNEEAKSNETFDL